MSAFLKTNYHYKLIITIVKKGMAKKLVSASKNAGAEGCTILLGRGTGIHEMQKFWGIAIEPEKEILLTLINEEHADAVLANIVEAGQLNKPGTGISFVIDMKQIAGIAHLLKAGS